MTCKRILFFILALVSVLSLAACGGEDKPKIDPNDPFTGEWMETRDDGFATTYEFRGDGTGIRIVLDLVNEIRYTYDESRLYVDVYVDDPPIRRTYTYTIEGDLLTIVADDSGDKMVLKKK